jgi:hypothetical protein
VRDHGLHILTGGGIDEDAVGDAVLDDLLHGLEVTGFVGSFHALVLNSHDGGNVVGGNVSVSKTMKTKTMDQLWVSLTLLSLGLSSLGGNLGGGDGSVGAVFGHQINADLFVFEKDGLVDDVLTLLLSGGSADLVGDGLLHNFAFWDMVGDGMVKSKSKSMDSNSISKAMLGLWLRGGQAHGHVAPYHVAPIVTVEHQCVETPHKACHLKPVEEVIENSVPHCVLVDATTCEDVETVVPHTVCA